MAGVNASLSTITTSTICTAYGLMLPTFSVSPVAVSPLRINYF